MRKAFGRIVGGWRDGPFWSYVSALVGVMRWRVALALVLMVARSVSQGAQLLLLVPLMQLVGLDVQQGSVGFLARFVSSLFDAVNVGLNLVTVLGAFVAFTALLALVTRWQMSYNSRLQQDFVAHLRRRLYRAITNTDWLTFSKSRASDFTHALTTELYRVGSATAFLLKGVTNVILISVYVLLALRLSVTMTALVFVSGAALLLLLRKKTQAARRSGKEATQATRNLYGAVIEHLGAVKTTKSYGVEERNNAMFSGLTEDVARTRHGGVRAYAASGFWLTVGSAVILSVILVVAFEVLAIPAAGLLLLLFLFNRMIPLLNTMQQSYQHLVNALPAFTEVTEMQARCEAAAEPEAANRERVELRREVRFEGVGFSYGSGGAAALRDLNFTIEAGKTTAIIGPSGAGKSTVADLVLGLLTPERGRILVDGEPSSAERTQSWRGGIGYVAQDTFLFNDTIRANLLWACPEADDEKISAVLKLSAAEGFVSKLPDGVQTRLGDRGVALSGGERQRLALARALLREPSLLILDEATSALDSENEKRVRNAIENLHGRMTILIITHRLSTVRRADVIHVLEEGRLVESGGWETLLRTGGRFGELCRAQGMGAGET